MTKKMKPSAAQRAVLEAMNDGVTLHWMTGLYPRAFLAARHGAVRTDTVLAMDHAGWIIRGGDSFKPTYTLTALGKRALENCK